jgi:hypothetical protein
VGWKAEHLALLRPLGRQVGETGNSHAGRKPTIDGGFDDTNVRFGSKPDISLIGCDVRFTPESGHG